jgi:predicted ribosome quality control (RQC) complex YloA/Tae2 family protein
MPLDAICLAAVKSELSEQVTNMRIEKVSQPERDIVVLSLRGNGTSCKLLISAGSGDARVHLTEHQFENPKSPPMFCMLLRKHIIGARIVSVSQPQAERVLVISLNAPDALGFVSGKQLIVELIGRRSNIILVDENMIIIDCLRRISGELSDRPVTLPGLIYRPPPVQSGKLDPLSLVEGEWDAIMRLAAERTVDKWLVSVFSALSPLICRELSWRAYGSTDYEINDIRDNGAALRSAFFELMGEAKAGMFEPWLLSDYENVPKDFSYTKIGQYENVFTLTNQKSFSILLDTYYTRTTQIERARQRASALTKTMKNARDRLVRKLAIQHEELLKTKEREKLRECGDIITANIHQMKKGQGELIAEDFFGDIGVLRTIKLDFLKTPQQNAARYYKEYTKAKNAEKYLSEQIRYGENELYYLESVLEEINLAQTERDLASIREELMETGYVRTQKSTKQRHVVSAPMRFTSSTGFTIIAGRNNIQNDQIALKTAAKSDIWLHVQKSHGAHVIISCGGEEPDDTSIFEAATIAAYYSSARTGSKVSVDYTYVKHVKKPSGSRPGMVIYTEQKTIIVTPDEELVSRLRTN